jgi:sulfite reductase (NADPH) flavoprotein alpha-component
MIKKTLTTMLPETKLKAFLDLVRGSTREELIWMDGYLNGMLSCGDVKSDAPSARPETQPAAADAPPSKAAVNKITIAYGTETGNSKKLALDLANRAKKSGVQAKLVSLDQYRLNDLQKEEYFFTVISTQGDGEPPAAAKKFYDHIHNNGFKLDKLKYGVLALGDTSYPLFCKTGEDVDNQFQKMGAQRIVPLQKCDTDYEGEATEWFGQVIEVLNKGAVNGSPVTAQPAAKKSVHHKKSHTGAILSNMNLNGTGSNKATYHVEIAAEEVEYLPGDSIGIVPHNSPAIVNAVIELTGAERNQKVLYRGEAFEVEELIRKKLNCLNLPLRVLKQYAALVKQDIPDTAIDLVDLLKIYPLTNGVNFEQLLGILEPITPRLYSIASSPEAHSGEIHLTVALDNFLVNGEKKYGHCSSFLAQMNENEELEYYVHKNNIFRLPEDDKDVIMVGPGTGIAPFRSFLAQREATGASGKNWLFFGDQHFTTDFLYQTEIQNWYQTGVLTLANVAFSRDQKEKVYVQHKMMKHGAALFEWLREGAYLYVCGAKDPMSVDVEKTLLEIIQKFGDKSENEALQFLDQMKEEGRYLKDVY